MATEAGLGTLSTDPVLATQAPNPGLTQALGALGAAGTNPILSTMPLGGPASGPNGAPVAMQDGDGDVGGGYNNNDTGPTAGDGGAVGGDGSGSDSGDGSTSGTGNNTSTGSTGSTTTTEATTASTASTTPTYQQPVDSRNSAIINSTNTRATNPVLPPGTEVDFTNISENSNEMMENKTIGSLGASDTTKAQAGQAEASQNPGTATYNATQIDKQAQDAALMEAATAAIDSTHLVSGRLTELLKVGSDGQFPTWASGAARKAQQIMAARGIDNSSMAGQAIMAAIIDAAVPIAKADSDALVAMDLQNLNNKQQAALVNSQQKSQYLLSNQAADNASKNFNASSINQANEFYANLATQVSTFNAAQRSAISQFNAGEENAMEKFDKTMQDSRDKFNTQNDLIVQQSNTQWRRQINTTNTAAQNEENRINATNKLGISNQAYANMWQQYRDESAWAFTANENKEDRFNKLAQIALYTEGKMKMFDAQQQAAFQQALGNFLAGMFSGALE